MTWMPIGFQRSSELEIGSHRLNSVDESANCLCSKAAIQLVANDPVSSVTLGGSWFFGHSQSKA